MSIVLLGVSTAMIFVDMDNERGLRDVGIPLLTGIISTWIPSPRWQSNGKSSEIPKEPPKKEDDDSGKLKEEV